LSHFLSCFGAGVTNLNQPPSSFLLPPHYCGLGAGSIPYRAIANNKQCEMRGLFMSLVIHYWIGDVQDCQGVSASEMTYIVSSGALNSTHSLTPQLRALQWTRLTKTVHTARLGREFVFVFFWLHVHVCFVLPLSVESLPFMFWRWRNKLKWASFELVCCLPIIAG